jgi:hypothetical protein
MWFQRSPAARSRVRRVGTTIALCALTALFFASSFWAGPARADDEADQARAYHEKAKAAFALSHYGQAAEFFEKAFELKSDPALLYNAAQSHRLAGNKDRALTLYQNYLHVYGRDDRRAQIEMRIDELKKSIERDRKEIPAKPPATWPPGTQPPPGSGPNTPPPPSTTGGSLRSAPPAVAPAPVEPLPSTSPSTASSSSSSSSSFTSPPSTTSSSSVPSAPSPGASPPILLTQPGRPSSDEGESVTHKTWFWVAVGGGVAAAAAVVLLVTLSGSKDPSATFGQAHGN